MTIATGKISWRSGTANKTYGALLTAMKNFIVNSGNYTLVTDQISASNYFVVKSVRNTGFTGDTIVTQISAINSGGNFPSPFIAIQPWESWSGVTGTNYGTVRAGYAASSPQSHYFEDHTSFSTTMDTDIWLSCDTTFILAMSRVYDYNVNSVSNYSAPSGVVNFERLTGDSDTGTFYGHFGRSQIDNAYRIYVPKRWDNSTTDNAFFNISTKLGNVANQAGVALYGIDESGNHVVFDMGVNLPGSGKIKGKIYGVGISTYSFDLGHAMLLPSTSSPQYIVGKPANYDGKMSILMQTSTTITSITT